MEKLKVYLIKASAGSSYSEYKKNTGGPPQNIFSAAAASPDWVDLEMCDETIGMKADLNSEADLVAIFLSTPDAYRAYDLARYYKKKGKSVVLGGLHTMFMEEEASKECDAVLIGEVEGIWEDLLNDFINGKMKKRYERKTPFDLAELKPYPLNIIPPSKYNYTWSVVVSRGCPYSCDFCLVPEFLPKYRVRPVENIVKELEIAKSYGIEWVELHSDNLTVNRKYALELFEKIAPLGLNFYGETTIKIADDEELLKAAQKAGVKTLLLGLETISKESLESFNKGFVKPEKMKEQIKKIKSYGIGVVSDFIFGFDDHDETIFEETYKFVKKLGVDEIYPHLLIPFPGSKSFNDLDKEGRIITKDWSKYDGSHVVYKPKKMSPDALSEGTWWFWQKNEGFFKSLLKNIF